RERRPTLGSAFFQLFSPQYARRTILNSLYLLVSIVGLWAGSVYVPASVTQLAIREGFNGAAASRLASYGTMLLSVGTIAGCLVLPSLAESLGRRATLACYFALMFLCISIGFGYIFYLPRALPWFSACL